MIDLLLHVRNIYHYCFYCGVEYENEEDLLDNCPGIEEDIH